MAMIENIRKRRGLLLFFIGLGMLGFLIPYDAVMSLFGNSPGTATVGELNGRTLSEAEWSLELSKLKDTGLNFASDAAIRTTAWRDLQNQTIYGEDLEALNYVIGEEELEDLKFGPNPSTFVEQAYYQGKPVSDESRQAVRNLFETQTGLAEVRQKELILKRYKIEKLEALLKKGFYANALDAKRDYLSKNDKVKIDLVSVKYDAIADSTLTVSDSDVMSFFNKNRSNVKYRQNPFRTISYISNDVKASAADSAKYVEDLNKLKDDFRNAGSSSEYDTDSAFVVRVSDDHLYFKENYKPGTAAGAFDSLLVKGNVGSLVGPYLDGGVYKLAKIVGKDPVVERANARHIFLSAGFQEKDSVMTLANDLKTQLEDGGSFSSLASKWSEDDSTATKGGSLGWFSADDEVVATEKVKNQLRNRILTAEKGAVQVIEVPGGYSVVEATNFEYDGVESVIVFLPKEILPSEDTKNEIYEEVRAFSLDYSSADDLIAAADEKGLSLSETKVFPTSRTVSNIANSEEMVRWVFARDTDKNDISNVFTIGDQYIVAALTEVQDDEVPNFTAVKDQVKADALKAAKFKMVKAKLAAEGKTLAEIAETIEGAKLTSPTLALNTTNIPGVSPNEAEAVGTAFGISSEIISPVIEGDAGAMVLTLAEPKLAAEKDSYAAEQTTLQNTYGSKYNNVRGSLIKSLIKDERNRR